MNKTALAAWLAALPLLAAGPATAATTPEQISILFVGNSYTFGRVDPVQSYNAANVHDLTAAFNAINPTGTNSNPMPGQPGYDPTKGWFEPHPWGGVPGVFKKMTDQAGLNYDVSMSTRNAASLRGQFLNTANADWNLRGNVASATWDKVVLQEQSDAPLPLGHGKNAAQPVFQAYAKQFEQFIHTGKVAGTATTINGAAAVTYKEQDLFGSLANCRAAGLSNSNCTATRTIINNTNFSASTQVYLEQTWARPDMVEAHWITMPDRSTADGRPIVDPTGDVANGTAPAMATLYFSQLAGMTTEMHDAFYSLGTAANGFAGVVPVGDAFQRAVDDGLVLGSGFYNAQGTFVEPTDGTMNLWWLDRTHASKYGSYLSALTLFGSITGLDPRSLGADEDAAFDLGLTTDQARALQRVAALELGFAAQVPEPATGGLLAGGLAALAWWARRRTVTS